MEQTSRRRVYSRVPDQTHAQIEKIARASGLTLSETLALIIVAGLRAILASQLAPGLDYPQKDQAVQKEALSN